MLPLQPFTIVNPPLSSQDLHEAIIDKLVQTQALHKLILFQCFDEQVEIIAPAEQLNDVLWLEFSLLNELEILCQSLH